MCGRCLSEGRSIHDDKKHVIEDESGYELKIYPGYCTLNPNYAAHQLIIRKISKRTKQSGVDLSKIDNPTIPPSIEQIQQENDTSLITTKSTEVETHLIQSSMSITQENMATILPVKPVSRSFKVSNLYVFVFDENMSKFPNLLCNWAHSILGNHTIVQFASSGGIENNNEAQHNWTVDKIHDGIKQYIDGFCSKIENGDQAASELQSFQHLSLHFTSLSKQLNNKYNVEAYLRLQDKLSTGISIKSLVLMDKPNFHFSLLAINYFWRWIRKFISFQRRHPQLSFNDGIPPVVVIFFEKSDSTTSSVVESSVWEAIKRSVSWGFSILQLQWVENSLYDINIIPR